MFGCEETLLSSFLSVSNCLSLTSFVPSGLPGHSVAFSSGGSGLENWNYACKTDQWLHLTKSWVEIKQSFWRSNLDKYVVVSKIKLWTLQTIFFLRIRWLVPLLKCIRKASIVITCILKSFIILLVNGEGEDCPMYETFI